MTIDRAYIDDALVQFRKLKGHADRAIAQVTDEQFFAVLDPLSNSIAQIMKHLAGNMLSRWTDFLMSDGEKPTRDSEFESQDYDTRRATLAAWERDVLRCFTPYDALCFARWSDRDDGKALCRRSVENTEHPQGEVEGV